MFNSEIISRNTYEECEAELRREIAEFDRDRLDFSVESTKMLGGGFKNPVILVRTSSACDYVAKAYTGSVEFHESRRARKFIMAAGGLVPEVVRVSDNEIICKSVHGESVKALFTSGNSQAPDAFYMLGRSLATIHSNTLNSMRLYDPRMLFKSGITKDYARLKEHIKILLKRKLVSPQTHNEFLRIKRKFFQKYVSLIQGDAHLDNFFYVSDPRSIIIIDYDDARPGDPLSDVGRVVASIRIWQYKGHLDEPYVERMIGLFFRGYRSVLNIELGGTNLYALRLYMIKLKSAEKLTEKIEYIIDNDKSIRDDCGGDLSRFFLNNTFMKAENYFHTEEFKKIVELKFCLGQIESFVHGKAVAVNDSVLR